MSMKIVDTDKPNIKTRDLSTGERQTILQLKKQVHLSEPLWPQPIYTFWIGLKKQQQQQKD